MSYLSSVVLVANNVIKVFAPLAGNLNNSPNGSNIFKFLAARVRNALGH